MKKYLVLTAIILMCSLSGNAQTKVWANDPSHSRLGFTIKHLTISEVDGDFTDCSVRVTTTMNDYSDAKVELMAKIGSINTESVSRDNHLLGADFFDEAKYPLLVFKSTSLKNINAKNGLLSGNLTMHGITMPVTLNVEYFGSVINPMSKKVTAGFKITGTVKRSDYSIGVKYPEAILGDEVNIVANLEFSPDK